MLKATVVLLCILIAFVTGLTFLDYVGLIDVRGFAISLLMRLPGAGEAVRIYYLGEQVATRVKDESDMLADKRELLTEMEEELHRLDRELRAKEQELDRWERELAEREERLRAETEAAETESSTAGESAYMARILVRMNPREAAALLAGLDNPVMLEILRHMSERELAEVISRMDSETALRVTRALTEGGD